MKKWKIRARISTHNVYRLKVKAGNIGTALRKAMPKLQKMWTANGEHRRKDGVWVHIEKAN